VPISTIITARYDPASILSVPITAQPGPAAISAAHHFTRSARVRGSGRKRRKSTCSPIWANSENTTPDAMANSIGSTPPPSDPSRPSCVSHGSIAAP
jgi:hypothetical protein